MRWGTKMWELVRGREGTKRKHAWSGAYVRTLTVLAFMNLAVCTQTETDIKEGQGSRLKIIYLCLVGKICINHSHSKLHPSGEQHAHYVIVAYYKTYWPRWPSPGQLQSMFGIVWGSKVAWDGVSLPHNARTTGKHTLLNSSHRCNECNAVRPTVQPSKCSNHEKENESKNTVNSNHLSITLIT